MASGLQPHQAVQCATAAALPAYAQAGAGVGATLTANVAAVLTIDGYAVLLGDRVLVKNGAAGKDNGIYTVTTLGTGAVKWVLTRAADFVLPAEVPGAFVFALNGTANGNQGFIVDAPGPYVIDTTAITWVEFTGAQDITVLAPIVKTGNQLSAPGVPTKYAVTFGDAVTLVYTITHNLNTADVVVMIYDISGANPVQVEADIISTGVNTITAGFAVAPALNTVRAVVIG